MFYHIIMKNFKSNLKNYILFFVSNILAIAELFAFWGLNDVVKKAVKDGVTAATLKPGDCPPDDAVEGACFVAGA